MRIVKGSKIKEISSEEFEHLGGQFGKCVVDIGTGDGRYMYENALKDPETLYIGLDPAQNQMKEYSGKANRKRLKNALFVVSSVENLPEELNGIADKVLILFPWGTLLASIVNPSEKFLTSLYGLLKDGGELITVFGYSRDMEPSETARLGLENIDITYVKEVLIARYKENGFRLVSVDSAGANKLAQFGSSWARTLILTSDRPMFIMIFQRG